MLGEWLQNYAKKMREKNAQKYFESIQRNRRLARERVWRNTKIPVELITPTIVAGLEKQAQYCIRLLQPSILVINICGRWTSRDNQPIESYAGVLGGYGDYGGENADVGFTYAPLKINQLFAIAFHQFEQHPDICKARARLHKAGIQTHWDSTSYNAASEFNLYYLINANSVAAIRLLAKEDWGVKTKGQSDEFDRVFDLYLKQNWASEAIRKEWREREPLAGWPIPKF